MTFQIVRYSPTYCAITDAQIGTRAKVLPMTYKSLALATKLAGRMHDDNYRNCGDDSFGVIKTGTSAFSRVHRPSMPVISSDDMPF